MFPVFTCRGQFGLGRPKHLASMPVQESWIWRIVQIRRRCDRFRAIGEQPFRARFNVDGIADGRGSPWASGSCLHQAPQVAVDEAGNIAPYLVFVDVWDRVCRDDMTRVCLNIGAQLHAVASGEAVFGTGLPEIRIPIPTDCEDDCLWRLWHAQSKALHRHMGARLRTPCQTRHVGVQARGLRLSPEVALVPGAVRPRAASFPDEVQHFMNNARRIAGILFETSSSTLDTPQ